MSQLISDKCNVAWFKLAEFVARKEKERALSIYRLLVHSLPDEAMRLQLEGDLLLAFNDAKALSCYAKAAELYESSGKIIEAIGVYEHCATLAPECEHYTVSLTRLFLDREQPSKALYYFGRYVRIVCISGTMHKALEAIGSSPFDSGDRIHLYELAICATLENSRFNGALFSMPLERVLQAYSQTVESKSLQGFLSKLSALSPEAHAYSCEFFSRKDA